MLLRTFIRIALLPPVWRRTLIRDNLTPIVGHLTTFKLKFRKVILCMLIPNLAFGQQDPSTQEIITQPGTLWIQVPSSPLGIVEPCALTIDPIDDPIIIGRMRDSTRSKYVHQCLDLGSNNLRGDRWALQIGSSLSAECSPKGTSIEDPSRGITQQEPCPDIAVGLDIDVSDSGSRPLVNARTLPLPP
jgi:hypothetical protein